MLNEFYEILKTKHISLFLSSKRIYDDNNFYNFFFVSEKAKSDEAHFLKAQYEQFLNDIKSSNFELLKKLIRIKELAYKIPAVTDPSMKNFYKSNIRFLRHSKRR